MSRPKGAALSRHRIASALHGCESSSARSGAERAVAGQGLFARHLLETFHTLWHARPEPWGRSAPVCYRSLFQERFPKFPGRVHLVQTRRPALVCHVNLAGEPGPAPVSPVGSFS